MKERPNERAARQIVSSILGLPVLRYEDGTTNGQVDALIVKPEGNAALEIIADHEDAFNAQWKALNRIGHKILVPELDHAWSAWLARRAQVKAVVRHLPAIAMAAQESAKVGASLDAQTEETMDRLGISALNPLEHDRTGVVKLHAEGWGGVVTDRSMADFVEQVLRDAPDVARKLNTHSTSERHAFIWSTIGTDYAIQFQLERRDQPLPTEVPRLPSGITHVWVAGSFNSQGVLAWSSDCGWWRPDWGWPTSGPLPLNDD
ncbi:hypothetical protein [Georgenia wangjunii]|uniref:hypothetical protein n=1 Tax=Georgenia wangjunii TaxID=3117730 RepID=UPI002F26987F